MLGSHVKSSTGRKGEGYDMVGRESLVDAARALGPVLRERSRETELLRRIPDETIADLQTAGLFKVLQPACYGGDEADLATYFDVVLTLSAADGSVGWVYSVLLVQSWAVSLMDPQAGKEVWGTDPSTLISSAVAPRFGLHRQGWRRVPNRRPVRLLFGLSPRGMGVHSWCSAQRPRGRLPRISRAAQRL